MSLSINHPLLPRLPPLRASSLPRLTPTVPTTMVRSLTQTLSRFTPLSLSPPPPSRLLPIRARSNRATDREFESEEEGEMIEDDAESIVIKKVEDAIHQVIVRRSQPDWIVFMPGASYWVPPKGRDRRIAEVIVRLVTSSSSAVGDSKDVGLKVVTNRGWPSSDYFFKGAYPSSVDVETSPKKTSQTEDEEG